MSYSCLTTINVGHVLKQIQIGLFKTVTLFVVYSLLVSPPQVNTPQLSCIEHICL
jgi:hypothetical protein